MMSWEVFYMTTTTTTSNTNTCTALLLLPLLALAAGCLSTDDQGDDSGTTGHTESTGEARVRFLLSTVELECRTVECPGSDWESEEGSEDGVTYQCVWDCSRGAQGGHGSHAGAVVATYWRGDGDCYELVSVERATCS
jgi:hypothetical protein